VRAPAISIEGTARIGDEEIFGPLRLEIAAGRWTSLLGASGAGKSTLLRLLAGLSEGIALRGRITCDDGQPLAPRTILMQQADLLLPWASVRDNVVIGARLRGERPDGARAGELIAEVGLGGLEHRKPSELSGGQRQRVALARTLAEDRPVVLLDEPFSALDPRTRRQMQDLALRLLSGRTVILVTHDPIEAARLGDRIVVMTPDGAEEVALPDAPASEGRTAERASLLMRRIVSAEA
jgi:putative hydroxymethylpyrimidine transport system ATP-binding protein